MKPEVRIIQAQQEEITPIEISNHEKEMILGKYGFLNNPTPTQDQPNNLSFEEMVQREEEKRKVDNYNKIAKINGPKPISFDGNYQSNTIYNSDPELGLNYKVEIVTNMFLPK